jgi:hypothetical protein
MIHSFSAKERQISKEIILLMVIQTDECICNAPSVNLTSSSFVDSGDKNLEILGKHVESVTVRTRNNRLQLARAVDNIVSLGCPCWREHIYGGKSPILSQIDSYVA